MLADPPQVRLARNYFDLGFRFVQERRGLQSALSRTDHRHSLFRKSADVPAFVAVNCLPGRKVLEYLGLFLERANPRGYYYMLYTNLFSVLQRKAEAGGVAIDAQNRSLIQV